jgi:hypothetical protein
MDFSLNLESEIKNKILSQFPNIEIKLYYEENSDGFYISMNNRDVYYSDSYQLLIMEVKVNILWKNNINNCYFIHETISGFNSVIESIPSSMKIGEYVKWNIAEIASLNDILPLIVNAYDLVA